MRTIAHLSDLHFGRDDPRAVEALVQDLHALSPSLVAVSGDLTQRARRSEFARARDFLARLPFPRVVVPGNHDVPLYDVVRRFAAPLRRYRAYVTDDLSPVHEDEELVALGISTARSFTWKEGRISYEQMEAVRARLCGPGPRRLHVLVAHHPFSPPAAKPRERLVGRVEAALEAFAGCGLDVVLTGHLHRVHAGSLTSRGRALARPALTFHAGSATSDRLRGEPNSYNLLRAEGPRLEAELRVFDGERFRALRSSRYVRTEAGWVSEEARPSPEAAPVVPA
ncbi:MAG TPA: metallophosphoesterase family protein [Anaeromyxobacter sp.]|nr:metallophosphoesterase family protein [Anaeromyxobacter sp.]